MMQSRLRLVLAASCLALTVTSVGPVWADPDDPPTVASLEEVLDGLPPNPASRGVVVVFIPGVLGSRLPGIWGDDTKPILNRLALDPSARYSDSSLLTAYPAGLTKRDVYGDFRINLLAVLGGQTDLKVFTYDWRWDIPTTAERLERRIRGAWSGDLKGKQVVVIAHSMGGLVAWHWKNHFYAKHSYEFEWASLVLLGSPLRGSCEIMRMLIDGYRPHPGASALEEILYRTLFDELSAAALTFPSLFSLLPETPAGTDPRDGCLVVGTPNGRYTQDHFARTTWKNFLLPLFGKQYLLSVFGFRVWETRAALWEQLGLSKSEFLDQVSESLKKGRDFRNGLDLREKPLDGAIFYIFGDQLQTTAQVEIDFSPTKGLKIVHQSNRHWGPGDGRVLEASARVVTPGDRLPRSFPVSSSHGGLLTDSSSVGYVEQVVNQALLTQSVAWILSDDGARAAYLEQGTIVPVSSIWSTTWAHQGFTESAHSFLQLNLEILGSWSPGRDPGLVAYQLAHDYSDTGETNAALGMYELALGSGGLEGSQKQGWALNNLGLALIEQERQAESYWPLKHAVLLSEEHPSWFLESDFKKILFNNFGMANEWRGEFDEALAAYRVSAEEGSESAAQNAARLAVSREW